MEYITDDTRTAISNYLQENLSEEIKSKSKQFEPIVVERINDWTHKIFNKIRETAEKGKSSDFFNGTMLSEFSGDEVSYVNMDKESLSLLTNNIHQLFNVVTGNPKINKELGTVGLLSGGQFKTWGGKFSVDMYWTKDNPYLYPDIRPKIEQLPVDFNAKSHLENAQKGEGTDVTLLSSDKQEVHFHLLYFKNHTDHFETMFHSEFKEGKTKQCEMQCSHDCLKNVQQFVYLGSIDEQSQKNLEALEDLLQFSHQTQMNHLFKYTTSLIRAYLKSNPLDTAEEIRELIGVAMTYELKEFYTEAVKAAEKADQSSRKIH